VEFQEMDSQTNTVTDSGTTTINGRNVELMDGLGQFTVSPDGIAMQIPEKPKQSC
jgi:hypothetical protein